MSLVVLKKYAAFYIALLVTALVMVLLFLRPDSALGLAVVVEQLENVRNQRFGFKLAEPVLIKAEVRFEGGAQIITADSATLDITQVTGDPGFLSVTSLKLPVREVTDENLTAQLPVDSNGDTQGTLFATVVFDAVKIVPADSDPAFAYAYDGVGETGGVIGYILTYTPPPIVGDYRATVTVKTDQTVTASTNFSVLPGLKIFALATLYPRSDTEALPGDLVILQVDLTNNGC